VRHCRVQLGGIALPLVAIPDRFISAYLLAAKWDLKSIWYWRVRVSKGRYSGACVLKDPIRVKITSWTSIDAGTDSETNLGQRSHKIQLIDHDQFTSSPRDTTHHVYYT